MEQQPPIHEINLLQRLKAGDEAAFDEVYTSYSRRIYLKVSRMVKVSEEVEELIQELFVRVWERRDQIDVQKPFAGYLYRIAENMVYDFYRKSARSERHRNAIMNVSVASYEHIEKDLFQKETDELLDKAIASLPPQCRQAFILCKIEEKSYEEAAAIMGISHHTVHRHIVKASQNLKMYLQQHKDISSTLLLLLALSDMP
ncbi:RNA polymerase sigma factor [Sphingobacterium yanglingense]|uniref:RNA polymerase sigma-70 factor (ECF subfamily) n=1 Tax=Sphingobacterium yanglingense TaxID=1437280 RepID=A0A4R6WKF1_9SPHI|nr:RNA polymerase sigma-70 factor [Sphingobacterium yanglingense]TDQ79248.1 RNA polymerase sigma-70 factor (ECF subfamily) [Sphingobacterium yanglingense]